MNEINKCVEILLEMSGTRRLWDTFIDEFIENFSTLNAQEINQVIDKANSKVRFGFMSQVFAYIKRNFDGFDDNQKRKVLNQLYLLIILENCDYDYRENILLAQSFSEATKNYSGMKAEEWNKVSHLATEKLEEYLEAFLSK